MKVLQFAFGGDGSATATCRTTTSPTRCVYTGTHDNDTTLRLVGDRAGARCGTTCASYLATDGRDIAWDLIRAAHASVGDTAIVPLQDVLGLASEHRMNVPGEAAATGAGASPGPTSGPTMQRGCSR